MAVSVKHGGGGLWDQDDMPEMGEGEQLFLSQTPSPALSWANPMSDRGEEGDSAPPVLSQSRLSWANPMSDRGEGDSAPPVLSQSRLVVDIPDV